MKIKFHESLCLIESVTHFKYSFNNYYYTDNNRFVNMKFIMNT